MRDLVVTRRQFRQIDNMFALAPQIVGIHVRDAISFMLNKARKEARRKAPRNLKKLFRRGGVRVEVHPFPRAKSLSQIRTAFRKSSARTFRLGEIRGRLFAGSDVVSIHEFGGTVRPQRGRFLTVPIGRAKKLSKKQRQRLKNRGDLFVKGRNRAGRRELKLARKTGEKTKSGRDAIEQLFVLRREVTVPARLGVRQVWESQAGFRRQVIDRAVDRIVNDIIKSGRLGRIAA